MLFGDFHTPVSLSSWRGLFDVYNQLMQLLMSFCGGTRRSQLEYLAEPLLCGSFSNCLNTIS